jgi:hypothetical protein
MAFTLSADFRTLPVGWRWTLRGLLVGPILVVAGILAIRQSANPDFEFVAASEAQTEKVLRYGPMVAESVRIEKNVDYFGRPAASHALCQRWLKAIESGELAPLPPVMYGDSTAEGPKLKIMRAIASTAGILANHALEQAKEGNGAFAATELTESYRLLDSMYTNDIGSVSFTNQHQRRNIVVLREIWDYLTPGQRKSVLGVFQASFERRDLEEVVERGIQMYDRFARRDQLAALSAEDHAALKNLAVEIRDAVEPEVKAREFRKLVVSGNGLPSRPVSDVSMAHLSEYENRRLVRELTKRKDPARPGPSPFAMMHRDLAI